MISLTCITEILITYAQKNTKRINKNKQVYFKTLIPIQEDFFPE